MKKIVKKSSVVKKSLSASEFDVLNEKLDFLIQRVAMASELAAVKKEIREMEKKWEERFKLILEAMDKQSKAMSDIQMIYSGVHMQLSRHEEWIKLIAEKNKIKLPL